MPPIILAGIIGIGAGIIWLFENKEEKKPTPPPVPTPKPEKQVNEEELRRVMSYLGKRSGKARGGKL